jgi:hypothetical protein
MRGRGTARRAVEGARRHQLGGALRKYLSQGNELRLTLDIGIGGTRDFQRERVMTERSGADAKRCGR